MEKLNLPYPEDDRAELANKPAGIKEMAKPLGVSIGTIDRALHGRPGINPLARSRVLSMAQTLGYQPNAGARYLKLKRKLHIAVHLPREIAAFFDALHEGIAQAAAPFQSSVDVEFREPRRLGKAISSYMNRRFLSRRTELFSHRDIRTI
jgi:LacI family transcriptional regulator